MKSYMCVICGFVYNEADGLPDDGIAAGTKWEDVPPNWVCPDCGARKEPGHRPLQGCAGVQRAVGNGVEPARRQSGSGHS